MISAGEFDVCGKGKVEGDSLTARDECTKAFRALQDACSSDIPSDTLMCNDISGYDDPAKIAKDKKDKRSKVLADMKAKGFDGDTINKMKEAATSRTWGGKALDAPKPEEKKPEDKKPEEKKPDEEKKEETKEEKKAEPKPAWTIDFHGNLGIPFGSYIWSKKNPGQDDPAFGWVHAAIGAGASGYVGPHKIGGYILFQYDSMKDLEHVSSKEPMPGGYGGELGVTADWGLSPKAPVYIRTNVHGNLLRTSKMMKGALGTTDSSGADNSVTGRGLGLGAFFVYRPVEYVSLGVGVDYTYLYLGSDKMWTGEDMTGYAHRFTPTLMLSGHIPIGGGDKK